MQRTEKYFENDAFRKTAAGVILAAEADAKTGGGRIALDGTVFYPEGGGQPADRGTLTLADGTVLHVTDVHETNGIIWHTVDALPETAQPGAAVTGTIDWEWRFDKMQQHTGEHILSGILHQMFGAENVGFHIGSDAVRMDTSVPISAEGLREAELAANRIVWENVPVLITYPTPEELAALTYRSKKEIAGQVRIVTIPGADICACCGTHVSNTGEIGLLRIFSCVRFHDGVRLELLCGRRALRYLRALTEQNRQVSGLLSAKPLETAGAVQRLLDAEGALKLRAASLEDAVFTQKAQALAGNGNVLLFEPAMSPDSVRRLTDLVMSACGGRAAVFAGSDEAGESRFSRRAASAPPARRSKHFSGKGANEMLQDLYPHIYHNEMAWKAPAPDDYALIFAPDGTVYCDLTDGALTLPRIRDVGPGEAQYAFSIDEAAYYLVAAHPDETDAFRCVPAASLRSMTERTSPALFAAAAGGSLHRWYRSQQFCGRCGAKMEKSTTERAMVCPQCKNTVYPKICPAVIVAVHDGDRLLLTRYRGRPFKKYALIAGFNETIEQTVHREVLEEAGVRVKNLRFYKSQPWVFTDTLLMGFVCELDGSDKITVQESELAEASWHLRSELPQDHSYISLTGEMIEQFRLGKL